MADVAASLKDWSTTAGSNSPSDSTTIGAGLADNFQQVQATVRTDLASKGADIASATTTDLGAVPGLFHDITGTTTITGFGTVAAGIWKIIKFEGALTLTHNATSLILPGGANITTADGDVAIMFSEGSGNWRCVSYSSKEFGSFTAACSGPFDSSNATVYYARIDKQVQLTVNSVRPNGNSTAAPITIDLTNMPASIRPVTAQLLPTGIVTNNGSDQASPGALSITTSGNATISLSGSTTNFTSTAGTVGFYGFSMAYLRA